MAKDTGGGGGTSGGAPDAPKSSGDPLLDQLQQTLWDIFKVKMDPGTLLGLADPAIDKRAKNDAASVRKWLKPGHPLLHPVVNYGLGMLSGRIDAVADTKPEPIKSLLRKGSDYLDSFRGELFGKESGKEFELDKEGEAVLKALLPAMTPILVDAFRELASQTVAATQSQTDPLTEVQLKKVRALARMLKILAGEDEETTEEPKVPWNERFDAAMDNFNQSIERQLGPLSQRLRRKSEQWRAEAQMLKERQEWEAAAKQPTRTDKLLKRLARVLF